MFLMQLIMIIYLSQFELHDLLNKPSLNGIPLLVLGNKIDNVTEKMLVAFLAKLLIDLKKLAFFPSECACFDF